MSEALYAKTASGRKKQVQMNRVGKRVAKEARSAVRTSGLGEKLKAASKAGNKDEARKIRTQIQVGLAGAGKGKFRQGRFADEAKFTLNKTVRKKAPRVSKGRAERASAAQKMMKKFVAGRKAATKKAAKKK